MPENRFRITGMAFCPSINLNPDRKCALARTGLSCAISIQPFTFRVCMAIGLRPRLMAISYASSRQRMAFLELPRRFS